MIGLALLMLVFVAYGLVSKRLTTTSITGPMVFTVAGLLTTVGSLSDPDAARLIAFQVENHVIQGLLTGTLVVVLFTDATRIDIRAMRSGAFLPTRLLGFGLPLTVAAGAIAAMLLFPDLGFWPAVVIAVILAPTDAALGQAVVSNQHVPGLVRQGIGVESGLNDGIAVPLLTIAVAGAAHQLQTGPEIAQVFLEEIGYAIVAGVAVGWLGSVAIRTASRRGWVDDGWRQVTVVPIAVLCYAVADPVGGSGFIAAFVGGLAFGAGTRRHFPNIHHFSENVSHIATMLAFFVFGALMLGPALEFLEWRIVLYAVLSLTIVRIIPVLVALVGTDLRLPSRLYIGWFGPRGLASLVFVGTVVVETGPTDAQMIVIVGSVTVGLSVLLHGLTASPLSLRYARWFNTQRASDDVPPMAEQAETDLDAVVSPRTGFRNPF